MICSSVHVFTQFMRGREAPNGLKNAPTRSKQKSHFLPTLRRWVTGQVLVVVIIIIIICAPSPPSAFTSGCILSGLWLLPMREALCRETLGVLTLWRYCAFVEAVPAPLGGTALQRWTCATSTISSPSDRLLYSLHLPSFGLSCLSTLVEQKYT